MSQPWIAPPARFLSGVSTQQRKSLLGGFPLPNPATANIYFNDFNTYVAGDWTVTTVNSGTTALQALNGGSLLFTPGGTSTNYQGITLNPASFSITPGYRAWFAANITVSDVAVTKAPSFVLGLTKGGPSAPTDGVYFTYAGGTATTVSAVIRASSTSSTITGIATPVAATSFTLGWFYDGAPTPTLYFYTSAGLSNTAFSNPPITGGVMVAAASSDSSYTAPNVLTNLPAAATVMAPQLYMVQPTTTTAPTIALDWMLCAAELARN